MAWKEHDLEVPLTIKGIARQVNSVYERTELFQEILRAGLIPSKHSEQLREGDLDIDIGLSLIVSALTVMGTLADGMRTTSGVMTEVKGTYHAYEHLNFS